MTTTRHKMCRVEVKSWDQRVSRCAVCVRQRGQNFDSSMRSGSLRRFFLVM
ncbi:50S ribosomal protein L33 [Nocardioides sp. CF8]|nr:50S ribosomal protein L33 [Nocardioides sp. CF8]